MRTSRCLVVFACALIGACDPVERPAVVTYPVAPPQETRIEIRPETRVVVGAPPEPAMAPGEWPRETRPTEILVTTSRKLDRPTEVVGVIDAHEPSGRQDAAFALIRSRARAMGGDAVVGVEFHHGDEKDEPTHLSGLVVRYLDRNP